MLPDLAEGLYLANRNASSLNQECVKLIDRPGEGLQGVWLEAIGLLDANAILICGSVGLQHEGKGQHLHS